MKKHGFTLIELLVVIAIILIMIKLVFVLYKKTLTFINICIIILLEK